MCSIIIQFVSIPKVHLVLPSFFPVVVEVINCSSEQSDGKASFLHIYPGLTLSQVTIIKALQCHRSFTSLSQNRQINDIGRQILVYKMRHQHQQFHQRPVIQTVKHQKSQVREIVQNYNMLLGKWSLSCNISVQTSEAFQQYRFSGFL